MKIRLKLFALYRDRAGVEEVALQLPEGSTVGDAIDWVRGEFPKLANLPSRVLAAVNLEYAAPDQALREGDEVALIPPVAGGGGEEEMDRAAIVERPIEAAGLLREVATTAAGAEVLFLGTVRDHSAGRPVVSLGYEAYPEMAESKMRQILGMARARWEVCRMVVEHRVGQLELGDVAVAVAVSAPHRQAAFEAGRFIIDTIKETVPIWKRERYPNGEEWVDPSTILV